MLEALMKFSRPLLLRYMLLHLRTHTTLKFALPAPVRLNTALYGRLDPLSQPRCRRQTLA